MSIKTRLRAAARALGRKTPRGVAVAVQWSGEEMELRDKYICREFDGLGAGYLDPITQPPDRYHWTRSELEAEATRRNVQLILIEYEPLKSSGAIG